MNLLLLFQIAESNCGAMTWGVGKKWKDNSFSLQNFHYSSPPSLLSACCIFSTEKIYTGPIWMESPFLQTAPFRKGEMRL